MEVMSAASSPMSHCKGFSPSAHRVARGPYSDYFLHATSGPVCAIRPTGRPVRAKLPRFRRVDKFHVFSIEAAFAAKAGRKGASILPALH